MTKEYGFPLEDESIDYFYFKELLSNKATHYLFSFPFSAKEGKRLLILWTREGIWFNGVESILLIWSERWVISFRPQVPSVYLHHTSDLCSLHHTENNFWQLASPSYVLNKGNSLLNLSTVRIIAILPSICFLCLLLKHLGLDNYFMQE